MKNIMVKEIIVRRLMDQGRQLREPIISRPIAESLGDGGRSGWKQGIFGAGNFNRMRGQVIRDSVTITDIGVMMIRMRDGESVEGSVLVDKEGKEKKDFRLGNLAGEEVEACLDDLGKCLEGEFSRLRRGR